LFSTENGPGERETGGGRGGERGLFKEKEGKVFREGKEVQLSSGGKEKRTANKKERKKKNIPEKVYHTEFWEKPF